MNPDFPNRPDAPAPTRPDIANPISSMLPGEQSLCQIARHPIGMIGIYTMAGLLLIIVAVLALIVAPDFITSSSRSKVMEMGSFILLFVAIFVIVYVFIANKIYWGNRWVLTTDSLTQISQTSLFDKQSSQLSLGNLEDVTAQQDGPLAHLFNFGVLRVETAGERSKFMFSFCPNPNFYAQQILGAREAFEQKVRQVGGVNEGNYPVQQYAQPAAYAAPSSAPAPTTVPLPPPPPAPFTPPPPADPYTNYTSDPTNPDGGGVNPSPQ